MIPLLACFLFTCPTLTFSQAPPAAAAAPAVDTYNILKFGIISKPGCPSKCGSLTVPYPFGIGIASGCAINSDFEVNCSTAFSPRRPLIGSIRIFEISDGRMRIPSVVSWNCYDGTGESDLLNAAATDITNTPFSYSDLNKFTIIGCDDSGLLTAGGNRNLTGVCASVCTSVEDVVDGDCSGKGCCQTSIAKGSKYYEARLNSFNNHENRLSFNPCGYAFVGEQGSYVFRSADLSDLDFKDLVEASVRNVVDWAIGNMTCKQVLSSNDDSYACKANNSSCVDSTTGLGGYRCSCNEGYVGNPYLDSGCIVDVCSNPNLHDCVKICVTTAHGFSCSCPNGEHGDGRKSGRGCTPRKRHQLPVTKMALGAGLGFLSLVIAATSLFFHINKRNLLKRRDKFFKRNGGFILKQRISLKDEGSIESTKVYTAEELKISYQ